MVIDPFTGMLIAQGVGGLFSAAGGIFGGKDDRAEQDFKEALKALMGSRQQADKLRELQRGAFGEMRAPITEGYGRGLASLANVGGEFGQRMDDIRKQNIAAGSSALDRRGLGSSSARQGIRRQAGYDTARQVGGFYEALAGRRAGLEVGKGTALANIETLIGGTYGQQAQGWSRYGTDVAGLYGQKQYQGTDWEGFGGGLADIAGGGLGLYMALSGGGGGGGTPSFSNQAALG